MGWATYCCARAEPRRGVHRRAVVQENDLRQLREGDLLWASDVESPHPFFVNDVLYVMPRVAAPAAACRQVEPLTGKVLDQFSLGVIGSCTRLTVTPNQFFYRPGGGEGRTVYVDLGTRKLADYEGVVRPGCFDGVVPANGRLYWMPLACDCWQVHGTFLHGPALGTEGADRAAGIARVGCARVQLRRRPATTGRCSGPTRPGRPRFPPPFRKKVQELWRRRLPGGDLTAPVCARRPRLRGRDRRHGAGPRRRRREDPLAGVVPCRRAASACLLERTGRLRLVRRRPVLSWTRPTGACWDALNWRPKSDSSTSWTGSCRRGRWAAGSSLSDDGIAYTAAGSTAADGSRRRCGGHRHGKIPLAAGLHAGPERAETELRRPGEPPAEGQHAVRQRRRPGGNRGPGRADRRQSPRRRPTRSGHGDVPGARRQAVVQRPRTVLQRVGQDDDLQTSSGSRLFPDVRPAHRPGRRPPVLLRAIRRRWTASST